MAYRILFLETPDIQKTPVGEKNEYTAAEKQKLSGIEAGAQKNTVDSVNGQTGPVTLNASDVGALPDTTPIPAAVTEQTVAVWGFTKNTGDYSKPSGGIPKTDLASDVRTSLGKADSALQEHQSLDAYRTASAQDAIDAAQNTAIAAKYTKPSGGIPASDIADGVIPSVPQMATQINTSDWTSGKTVDAATLKTTVSAAGLRVSALEDDVDALESAGYQTAQDVQTAIANLQTKAITDTGGYYTTDTVDGALQEIGAELAGVNTLIGSGVIS